MRRLLRRWSGTELLADELNQFAMQLDEFLSRELVSANSKLDYRRCNRLVMMRAATFRLRNRIACLIPD